MFKIGHQHFKLATNTNCLRHQCNRQERKGGYQFRWFELVNKTGLYIFQRDFYDMKFLQKKTLDLKIGIDIAKIDFFVVILEASVVHTRELKGIFKP